MNSLSVCTVVATLMCGVLVGRRFFENIKFRSESSEKKRIYNHARRSEIRFNNTK